MPQVAREMTIPQAARELGMSRKTLWSRITVLERQKREQLFPRRGDGQRIHVAVTWPLLRKHFPGWFPRRDELAEKLRNELKSLREEMQQMRTRDTAKAVMLAELQHALAEHVANANAHGLVV